MDRLKVERAAELQQRGADLQLLWDEVGNLKEHEMEGVTRTEETMHLCKGMCTCVGGV